LTHIALGKSRPSCHTRVVCGKGGQLRGRLFVTAALVSALLAACGGEKKVGPKASLLSQPRSPVAQQHAAARQTSEVVYQGALRITVAYYGYDCGLRDLDLHHLGTKTYRMSVKVVRGPRAAAGSIRESGPFNLVVSADPGNEAGITIVSATVVSDPRDGKPILFEYWKVSRDGSRLQGTLVNSWRRAGLAANVFPTDRLIVPCRPDLGLIPRSIQTIDEGARLSGTITDDRAELTIVGRTFDKERRFTARVSATR
jgi:hypothetical protein